jgi:L-alanine-DL-glutamate epimerase-like enolase superfamily enzyme
MTAIRALRTHRVDLPLVRPFVTAVRRATSLSVMLIEAVDADGRSGWGEAAASWRVTGESPGSIRAAVKGPLAEVVIGRGLGELPLILADLSSAVFGNAAARSAVDSALHDLAAQRAGLPLFSYLGGADAAVVTDMTLSAGTADALVSDAVQWRDRGFGTIKVKVGSGHDDLDSLRSVRDAVGPDVRIRVDANQAWSAREAVEIITAWENFGLAIELVEQPVAARAIDELAFVTERVSTPILADESVWTARDLTEIVRRHAADLVNLKLAKTGGLHEALRLIETARDTNTGVLIGCMMESIVGVSTAASLATLLPGATHDLDAGLWQTRSPVLGGAHYDMDRIVLSATTGIGVEGLA